MIMNLENKVKWCPVCEQGWVKIVKEINTDTLYLCCSECEAEWSDPDKIEENTLGSTSFTIICTGESPRAFAAIIYSLSRMVSTSVLTILAIPGHISIPIIRIRFQILPPITAARATAMTKNGKHIIISTISIITLSVTPPK